MQRLALGAGAGILLCLPALHFSASKPSEYEVKAAYLYNFGRFVQWPQDVPSSQAGDFAICVLGQDPFGRALDSTIDGEKIEGKNVVARRLSSDEDARSCRVLFISTSEGKRIKDVLAAVDKQGVLTVSDLPEFTSQGGMVQFVLRQSHVRFEINLGAARQAGLNLSSELLKVADKVQ